MGRWGETGDGESDQFSLLLACLLLACLLLACLLPLADSRFPIPDSRFPDPLFPNMKTPIATRIMSK
ncbi:hypothetical protein [Moorena sp. SIO4G3]|uniref:hypothetical protein n=1 Tax=Moorena sp. SIO4G3 TaxID=2607821 RepID=UPI00142AA1D3|nr:hypothetical protein [Moorena sp. SIO4G3]NEO75670.1 hypothetical protein [Moorena sp. SIO4G3]